jgi:hypothetical protein
MEGAADRAATRELLGRAMWAELKAPADRPGSAPIADREQRFHAPHLLWRAFPILTVLFLCVAAKAADPVVWIVIRFSTRH